MEIYDKLLVSLLRATADKKVAWSRSPKKGGHFTKIGDKNIEVLPPAHTMGLAAAIAASGTNLYGDADDKVNHLKQWRLIVYNSDGEMEYTVIESKVDGKEVARLLNLEDEIINPIKFLSMGADLVIEEEESSGLKNLIKSIENL